MCPMMCPDLIHALASAEAGLTSGPSRAPVGRAALLRVAWRFRARHWHPPTRRSCRCPTRHTSAGACTRPTVTPRPSRPPLTSRGLRALGRPLPTVTRLVLRRDAVAAAYGMGFPSLAMMTLGPADTAAFYDAWLEAATPAPCATCTTTSDSAATPAPPAPHTRRPSSSPCHTAAAPEWPVARYARRPPTTTR